MEPEDGGIDCLDDDPEDSEELLLFTEELSTEDARQTAAAPKTWNHPGIFNPVLVMIWTYWLAFQDFMLSIPTIDGLPVIVIAPMLPWFAKDQENLRLVMLWLHYCPLALAKLLGGRHPSAGMNSNGELLSATWELLRCSLGDHYWLCLPFIFFDYKE